jgi:DNA-binding NarL/FixJ family response regulator
MDRLVEALQHAHTTAAIGRAVVDAVRRHIGHSGFSLLRVSGPVVSRDDVFALCSRRSPACAAESVLELIPLVDRELAPLAPQFARRSKSFDLAERFDPAVVRQTRVFNEYWRPFDIERQLVGYLGTLRSPIGFICITRSIRERAFTVGELRGFDRLRATLHGALVTSRHLGFGTLEEALSVLARATRAPWFLFDAAGNLLWLTEEAYSRLSLDAWRFGSSVGFRHSQELESLRAWVRARARGRGNSPRAAPALRTGAPYVMRRFATSSGRALFLVGFADPASPRPGALGDAPGRETTERAERLARRSALTPRQTEVLRHLAHGKPNKTIAAQLGCAEVTVELHVTALLEKLGCENRTELVARFWNS